MVDWVLRLVPVSFLLIHDVGGSGGGGGGGGSCAGEMVLENDSEFLL